jgi:DNA-binding transcriptional LysR family regulator
MPRDHALAPRKRIALRALDQVPLVLVARRASPDVYDYLLESCRVVGIVPNVRREASQVHTALALVGGGVGVSLLPQSASRLRLREVAFRPLVEPLVSVFVLAHAVGRVSPIVAAFTEAAMLGRGSTL